MTSVPTFTAHPGVRADCPRCRGDSYVISPGGETAAASLCSCVDTCPVCNDTTWMSQSKDRMARRTRCVCQQVLARMRLFNAAQIPGRMARADFRTFKKDHAPAMRAFMQVASYVKKSFIPDDMNRGLVLYGDVGRGKTHLMVATLRDLVFDHGVSVCFVEFTHLLADLKSGFGRGKGASRLLDPLTRVDVLAIDELGKGRQTEFEGTVLDELVTRRYNAGRTIIATSNYAPGPLTGRIAPDLARLSGDISDEQRRSAMPTLHDRVGPRVYSRLQEMCDFVHVGGNDFRERKRQERVASLPALGLT